MKLLVQLTVILVLKSVLVMACNDENEETVPPATPIAEEAIEEVVEDEPETEETSAFTYVNRSAQNLPVMDVISNSMDVEPADLDGDGDLDLVIASEFEHNLILYNDGSGKFTSDLTAFPVKNYDSEDIAIADFNQDGVLDIVFVSEDNQTNEYYLGAGNGNYTDAGDLGVSGTSNCVIAEDITNDGYPDLFIGNGGQNFLLINDGAGNFLDETTSRLPVFIDTTQDAEFGDVDNDDDLDILVGNENINYLLINDGNGVFTRRELPHAAGVIEETREADLGDIDNDGDLDIFFANVLFSPPQNKDASNRILINDGTGNFTDETSTRFRADNQRLSVDIDFADLDDDGDLDAVLANAFGTFHQILINNNGVFTEATSTFWSFNLTNGIDVELADYNNDGLLDFYFGVFQGADQLVLSEK